MSTERGTILLLSQVYVPDPASVGQHMHDAAVGLIERGYRVVALVSSRGYDDPSQKYPRREVLDGVEIRRLPWTSFGKSSILSRLLGSISFVIQCSLWGLFTRRLAGILSSTSPPLCPLAAVFLAVVRRRPIGYWVMDLNPDQAVALGQAEAGSWKVRAFDAMNRLILRRAARVITLDRFMAERVNRKVEVGDRLAIMPPWPHQDHLEPVAHEDNPFRVEHGLENRFVVMYSGNHSPSSPLTTILEAAIELRDDPDLVFLFIGGGLGKQDVEQAITEHRPGNIVSLPYQPLDRIKYSLSAADVHLVAIGPSMVGMIHPCKVYGAMAISRPILLLGPTPCHVSDILERHPVGWKIEYGDVEGAVRTLREIAATGRRELQAMGEKAGRVVESEFSKERLLGEFCDALESGWSEARS